MKTRRVLMMLVAGLAVLVLNPDVRGDGTEVLDIPSIPVAPGTDAVYAGVGLLDSQPETLQVNVPSDVTIEQVLLYWSGRDLEVTPLRGATDTISVDGNNVQGILIGGPITTGSDRYRSYVYRADITSLGLVGSGANALSVGGLTFTAHRYGAGIVIITDDGVGAVPVELRDGLDFAFLGTAVAYETIPQTFQLGPSDSARNVVFKLMVADVTPPRPNALYVTAGDEDDLLINTFFASDGNWWDTLTVPVVVPAGAESVTIQPMSYDDGSGLLPSSLFWINVSLSRIEILELFGCTPGFWKNHQDEWPEAYAPGDLLSDVFDMSGFPSLASLTLEEALAGGGGSGLTGAATILLRAAVAALLNEATYGVAFPPYDSVQLLINSVDDVLLVEDRQLMIDLAAELDTVNNLGCREDNGEVVEIEELNEGPNEQSQGNQTPGKPEELEDGVPPGLSRASEAAGKPVGPIAPSGFNNSVPSARTMPPTAVRAGRKPR